MKTTLKILALVIASMIFFNFYNANETVNDHLSYESGYDDFLELAHEIKGERENRLINFDTFLEMKKDSNTIVLDSRSSELYINKHLKGAINLPFPQYTQKILEKLIPNKDTRILIYCNNNFIGDEINFGSKSFQPSLSDMSNNDILSKRKPILLALNIPTYITLSGYGYNNIYELSKAIHVNDPRVIFEGERTKFVRMEPITIKSTKQN